MSKWLRLLGVVCVLALATTAFAGGAIDQARKVVTPIPIPFNPGSPAALGAAAPSAACLLAYDDMLPTGSSFLPLDAAAPAGGLYVEYADDCHLLSGGALCEFTFTYFEPGPGPTDIIITLYGNDAGDTVFGAPVAGPYLLSALPAGLNSVTVPIVSGPVIPADVWFSITGPTTITHGLVIAGGPPTVGVSHDLFLHVPSLGLVFFGGPPTLANFNVSISVDATVPTEEKTWGSIKSLFQD